MDVIPDEIAENDMDELQIRTVRLLAERGHPVITGFRPSIDYQLEGDAIDIIDGSPLKHWPYEITYNPEDGDGLPHETYVVAIATPAAPGSDGMADVLSSGTLVEAIDAILAHRGS